MQFDIKPDMKASYILKYGKKVPFKYGDLPNPVPSENQLLVEVKAVSVNPVDFKIKSGIIRIITGFKFPKILGSDYAGIVKSTGQGVIGFKPGDRIYGALPTITGKQGSLAEFALADKDRAHKIPDGMSFEEAASLPVAALTALTAMRKCNVKPGTSLLINGATGGVGHFAIQIAKAKGVHVTATCSSTNAELAKFLGADEVTGYSENDLVENPNKYDAIFDAYGKMKYPHICRLLKKGGIYASPLFFFPSQIPAFFIRIVYGKTLTSANIRGLPEDYGELGKQFTDKKLKPLIERTFKLEETTASFEFAENGRPRGKVIIRI
jgi:NADPH:quinone reductase-like Zn-dependent oxidoreductase